MAMDQTPLAEALVKVKLGFDKSEIQTQTTRNLSIIGKGLNKEITNYKKQAAAFRVIGNEIGKVATGIFRSLAAPAMGVLTGGVYKYMQTTDAGAQKLRLAMAGLRWSFDQFLARVGKAIFNTGILTKVIEKLKRFLDSIDDKKIAKILEVAKWSAVLYVIVRMVSWIGTLVGTLLRVNDALNTISKNEIFRSMVRSTAKSIVPPVAAGIGAGAAAGITASKFAYPVGAIDVMKFMSGFKERFGKESSFEERSAFTKRHGEYMSAYKDGALVKETSKTVQIFSKLSSKLAIYIPNIVSGLEKLAKGLFIFDMALAGLRGLHVDLGSSFDIAKQGILYYINAIWTIIKVEWQTLVSFVDFFGALINSFELGMEAFTGLILNAIKGLKGLNWTELVTDLENIFARLVKLSDQLADRIGKRIGNLWTPLEGDDAGNRYGKERRKKMDQFAYLPQNITTTSFAGLQAAAQSMITKENYINTVKDNTISNKENTEAIRKLSEKIREANSKISEPSKGGSGLSDWLFNGWPFNNSSSVSSNPPVSSPNGAALVTM